MRVPRENGEVGAVTVTARPLPPLATLTDAQRRGADCVFCATPLRNRASVDLGMRRRTEHGQALTLHPRRCAAACRVGGAGQ
ncbi:hypothetical protein [Streptomyces sp. NBC_00059]|uniref:hypothetical protein n=1 Tax=Streptomyces sp. NBC_00059 TaxID=2975635 RepID=UPI002252ABA8|nr:hypothetical protein [Streptomyces sp. NBC_00059]MCX5412417.1 hypothetical protein [Streptomyces sp. NBC_00059]